MTFASGTPEDDPTDGSALSASGTVGETQDDGSDDGQGTLEQDPQVLAEELERQKRINRQLLSEKQSGEEARAEARELRQLLTQMNRGAAREQAQEDGTNWGEVVNELSQSDDPRDKFTLALAQELHETKLKLARNEESKVLKIDPEDLPGVEKLMSTGEFRSMKAAHKAYLGDKFIELQAKAKKTGLDPVNPKPTPKPKQQQPVSTVTRSVPREKAKEKADGEIVKASEYRQMLRRDGSAARQQRLSGAIIVVQD